MFPQAIDFGVATHVSDDRGYAMIVNTVGASAEQVLRTVKGLPESDVFALGTVFAALILSHVGDIGRLAPLNVEVFPRSAYVKSDGQTDGLARFKELLSYRGKINDDETYELIELCPTYPEEIRKLVNEAPPMRMVEDIHPSMRQIPGEAGMYVATENSRVGAACLENINQ
eukprot:452970_1